MILQDLSQASRVRMSEALRAGDPVRLELSGPVPADLRLADLAPLCYAATSTDPRDQRVIDAFRAPAGRPGGGPGVTVILPCSRGMPLGVPALLRQDLPVRVLVLANGPEAPTRVPGAELLQVPWLGHGPTRQAALSQVRDPYVFFTVDDALVLGAGFLRTLVDALESGGWDAVTARQIAWPDADAVTADRVRRWTPAGHQTVPAPQADHVASLYRTETLRQHPLPPVPIAEDAAWSRGRRVGYVPMAPVVHSHTRSPGPLYRRTRDIHAQLVAHGQAPVVDSLGQVMGALPGVVRPAILGQRGEWQNQVAELLGQWRGARLGRTLRRKAAGKG